MMIICKTEYLAPACFELTLGACGVFAGSYVGAGDGPSDYVEGDDF